MNTSSKIIKIQPIVSYLDKDKDKTYKSSKNIEINHHKNSCEKCITCNSTAERYPINCSEFFDTFKLYEDKGDNGSKQFGLYSCCCFPITLPFNTICCGSCTLYNISRNKCNNTKKNYLC